MPDQAETVRIIYKLFLEGMTTKEICIYLMEHRITAPSGKGKWFSSTVASILTNEGYKGSALLQRPNILAFNEEKSL